MFGPLAHFKPKARKSGMQIYIGAVSSFGRAPVLHTGGVGFDPPTVHMESPVLMTGFCC